MVRAELPDPEAPMPPGPEASTNTGLELYYLGYDPIITIVSLQPCQPRVFVAVGGLQPGVCFIYFSVANQPSYPSKEPHYHLLYSQSHSFSYYEELVTIGVGSNVDQPISLQFPQLFFHNESTASVLIHLLISRSTLSLHLTHSYSYLLHLAILLPVLRKWQHVTTAITIVVITILFCPSRDLMFLASCC